MKFKDKMNFVLGTNCQG